MNILVIGGGISPEREVSLRSSKAVENALNGLDHRSFLYDWDGSTDWLRSHGCSFDMIFPILHGEGGEDGYIQKILEGLNIPFLGSDSTSSRNCMNKDVTRRSQEANNIQIPRGDVVDFKEYKSHDLYNKPHVLKPVMGGSSIDTHIFNDATVKNIVPIEASFNKGSEYLIEEYIFGIEVTASILGEEALPIAEIIPPPNEVFDFANKYNGKTREICPPENISISLQKDLQEKALLVHNTMGCRHISRVDMIINKKGIHVLEINTMPGMTEESLFPRAARAYGKSLGDVAQIFVSLVNAQESTSVAYN